MSSVDPTDSTPNSDESLLEKHDTDSIFSEDGYLRPKPANRPFKRLLAVQALTICLLPVAYLLGFREGAARLPKLPTDRTEKTHLVRHA